MASIFGYGYWGLYWLSWCLGSTEVNYASPVLERNPKVFMGWLSVSMQT